MPRTRWFALFLILGTLVAPARAAELPQTVTISPVAVTPLADMWNWDWEECRKFWSKQLGKTTGVLGAVTLVVAVGVLIVMSAKKKT